MPESTTSKAITAAIAAFMLQWARIPDETWLLAMMMMIDFILGNAVAIQDLKWNPRTFGNGIIRKLSAFLMLGALAIVKGPLGLNWDIVKYFTDAAIVYEFLSAGQSHVHLRGPGWQWIQAFSDKVKAFLVDRKIVITQDAVAAKLERAKDEGEQNRA